MFTKEILVFLLSWSVTMLVAMLIGQCS